MTCWHLYALSLLVLGCAPKVDVDDPDASGDADDTGGASPDGGETTAVITTQSIDYSTGTFATVDLDGWTVSDELFPTAGDASVAVTGGYVYQLNRYGTDVMRRYTPGAWSAPDWEVEVGDLANPYDVALCGDQLLVSLYGRDHIGVYDPDSGIVTGSVDLSAYADGDSVGPEGTGLVALGDKVYIGLNRLNRDADWADAGGRVVEVDCGDHTVQQDWAVGGNTVVADTWEDKLVVAAGGYGGDVGGLYVIDPGAGTKALLTDLDAIGEAAVGIAVHGDAGLLITAALDYSHYAVHCVDMTTGDLVTAEETPSYLRSVQANDRGEAWIAAHWGWIDPEGAEAGVWVYDIDACASLTDAPIQTSLGPSMVAFY